MPSRNTAQFHQEIREWSARKHQILTDYLQAASNIFGSRASEIWFVDGFAGRGRFGDGMPQSSVLAVEIARQRQAEGKTPLRCINIEKKRKDFLVLKSSTEAVAPDLVTNYHGTFHDHSEAILKQIGTSPAIVFLDPFGLHIPWSAVSPLLRRRYTDVLINFMGEGAARTVGRARSPHTGSEGYAQTLDQVIGEGWRGIAETTRRGLRRPLCDLYKERLAAVSGYACDFDVKGAEDEVYKYTIMLATKAPVAVKIMNDTFYKTERTYEREVRKWKQLRVAAQSTRQLGWDFFEAEPTKEQIEASLVSSLTRPIVAILSELGPMSVINLRVQLWKRDWFARATSTHQNRAIRELAGTVLRTPSRSHNREDDLLSLA